MSSEALTLKESLIPFFGEPEKALLFFNANYEKGVFSEPINSASQPESILDKKIFEMMLAKNYVTKEPGMEDNDIHYQFVDFIVRTALLHKELDRPTSAYPTSQKMKASYDQTVESTLKTTLRKIDNFDNPRGEYKLSDILNGQITHDWYGADNNTQLVSYKDLLNTSMNSNLDNSMDKTYYDFITAAIFSISYNLTPQQNQQINPQLLNQYLRRYFEDLSGNCDKQSVSGVNVSPMGNLCYMTYWDKNDPQNSAVRNLQNLLMRVANQLMNDGVQNAQNILKPIYENFLNEMDDAFVQELMNHALRIYRECGLNDTDAVEQMWSGNTKDNIRKIFQNKVLNNVNLQNSFVKGLQTLTTDIFQRAISAAGIPAYRAIPDSEFSSHFCTHVLGNWKDLNREAHEFYRNQIAVYRRLRRSATTGPTASSVRLNGNGQRPLDNNWIGDYSLLDDDRQMEKIDCDKENIRINLMKEKRGSENIMFCHTLPYLPVNGNFVGKLWYTDNTGARRFISKNNLSTEILKVIYDGVYKDVTTSVNTKPVTVININNSERMSVPGDYLLVQKECDKKWDLVLSLIVKNLLKSHNRSKNVKSVSVQELMDTSSGMIWFNDEHGLYKVENGRKVRYEEYKQRGYNCDNVLSLNKNKVNTEQCRQIAQCILESPENLESCLKNYEDGGYDIFNVAKSEIEKLDPHEVKKLLKVFHVGIAKSPFIDKNGNNTKIIRPCSYTEWTNRVLNANELPKGWSEGFKRRLMESTPLLNYVKGIIDFARSNPAILNPDYITNGSANLDDDDDDDEQLQMLRKSGYNIGTYYYPYPDSREELGFNVGFMVQSAKAFAPVTTTFNLPFSNAIVGDGIMTHHGMDIMGGGAIPEGEVMGTSYVANLAYMLSKIIVDLKRKGLSFAPEQEQEINKFIKDMGKNEQRIKELIQVLSKLKNLQSFAKCYDNGRQSGSTSGKVLSLDEIVSHSDLLSWLNSNIGDYEKCIYQSMEYINEGSQQVLEAYKDLIRESSHESSKF